MNEKFWRMLGSRKALSKMQAVFIVIVVVVAIIGAVYYYTALPAPPPAPFSMQVIPEHIGDSVAGQRCVFLVVVRDEGEGSGKGEAVSISAKASSGSINVYPETITPEQVAEVTVIPDEPIGANLTVTVYGERDRLEQTETVTLYVAEEGAPGPGGDEMGSLAAEIRDEFVPWLAENHPEFGITSETAWTGTIVRPHHMVVMFYLFFSEEWEMGVSWHVMIPPHDWARIYLRHRFTEVSPSHAFEISSREGQDEPHAVDLKEAFAESVWR